MLCIVYVSVFFTSCASVCFTRSLCVPSIHIFCGFMCISHRVCRLRAFQLTSQTHTVFYKSYLYPTQTHIEKSDHVMNNDVTFLALTVDDYHSNVHSTSTFLLMMMLISFISFSHVVAAPDLLPARAPVFPRLSPVSAHGQVSEISATWWTSGQVFFCRLGMPVSNQFVDISVSFWFRP